MVYMQPFRGTFWKDGGGQILAKKTHFVKWHDTEVGVSIYLDQPALSRRVHIYVKLLHNMSHSVSTPMVHQVWWLNPREQPTYCQWSWRQEIFDNPHDAKIQYIRDKVGA
jgi:hypothetical protein